MQFLRRMTSRKNLVLLAAALFILLSQTVFSTTRFAELVRPRHPLIRPLLTTETSRHDTDDPAIWIDRNHPEKSLILGTDKHRDGALYVYDLKGKILRDRVRRLARPNNVDVEYGLTLDGDRIDIAVVTEVLTEKLRIFRLPDMEPVDKGGIEVFRGEPSADFRSPMGIALYKRPEDGTVFAIVSRRKGPKQGYLWQYRLEDDGKDGIRGVLVRKFGAFSGGKGIEAVAVDDPLGYVYYADERDSIRKYFADPDKGDGELARFGTGDFLKDREGIAIYPVDRQRGYLLVSDQGADRFRIYRREGSPGAPHRHALVKTVYTAATKSDGCEVTPFGFNGTFPQGLFVAMSDDRTFQLYSWRDLMGDDPGDSSAPGILSAAAESPLR